MRICNKGLLWLSLPMVATSIALECAGGGSCGPLPFLWLVVAHVAVSVLMMLMVTAHVYLHFGWQSWITKWRRLKSRPCRWLAVVALLTLVSGMAATALWCAAPAHTTFGGVHGKIGYIFILLAAGHTLKRRRWFNPNRS